MMLRKTTSTLACRLTLALSTASGAAFAQSTPQEQPAPPPDTAPANPTVPPASESATVPAPTAASPAAATATASPAPDSEPVAAPQQAIAAPESPAPATPNEAEPKPFKGFVIQSEDERYQLKLGGFVQADARFFTKGAGDPKNTFAVRRARLEFRGTLAKYFELRIHPELAESKLTLLDAFGNIHFVDELQLQVGKMKSPVGLEYLQSPTELLFPEFGLPTLLVPQRDVGAYVHGDVLKGTLAYQLGAFNGVADGTNGDLDENADKDLEGRIFLHPFKPLKLPALEGFGVGVAGTVGKQEGVLPSFRTPGREAFFGYVEGATAKGNRTRISPQAYYYVGPIGVFGEYVRSKQAVSDGAAAADIVSEAWQVAGSFVLGGSPGYKGPKLQAPLDPLAGTWGALELAARYAWLGVHDDAFDLGFADPLVSARSVRSLGIAASWWFVKGTRAVLSYDQTSFDGGAASGDRENEGVLVARLQVAL
jgi:phosphate-selective porin OprO and OprP